MAPGSSAIVPNIADLGSRNLLLTARGKRHSVRDFPGPLSIKTVLDGAVRWRTDGRDIHVDDTAFLVLNDGEPYSMEIDAREPVTTCCVFFEHGFVENVARSLGEPDARLLDDPNRDVPLTFVSRLHPRDNNLTPALRTLRRLCIAQAPQHEIEEHYLILARSLLLCYQETLRQMARVPAARASTRAEMLRRASRGREFLHAQAHGPVSLQAAARAACLSSYHFHRVFTAAFGQSPHSYLT
jgi:AraC-like DNA-binding protein